MTSVNPNQLRSFIQSDAVATNTFKMKYSALTKLQLATQSELDNYHRSPRANKLMNSYLSAKYL